MNKVILMGRLTRDPEVRYSTTQEGNQTAIARYTLAVDRRYNKNGEQTADFISCVTFGKNAEFVEKYLAKGTKIAITGRIQTGSYTNKDGNKVYTTDVVVDEHEFAESKSGSGNGGSASPNPQSASAQPSAEESPFNNNGFMNIPEGIEDDLPF